MDSTPVSCIEMQIGLGLRPRSHMIYILHLTVVFNKLTKYRKNSINGKYKSLPFVLIKLKKIRAVQSTALIILFLYSPVCFPSRKEKKSSFLFLAETQNIHEDVVLLLMYDV